MQIHKSSVALAIHAVLPGRREVAEQADPRRGGASNFATEREVKVYAYNPCDLEVFIRQLEEHRAFAGEYQPRDDSAMLHNRAKQALNAYRMQQDLPQDESLTVLRQMLGVDDYA
jgi:hypothetical protein